MSAVHTVVEIDEGNTSGKHRRMRIDAIAVVIALGASLFGCARPIDARLKSIANLPIAYLGQKVRVCGWIRNGHEDHGIWVSRKAHRRGDLPVLGLIAQREGEHWDSYACLSGEIVRTGCGEETICIDTAAVPFALKENDS